MKSFNKSKNRKFHIYCRKFGFELESSTPFEEIKPIAKKIIPRVYGKNKIAFDTTFSMTSSNAHYKKWELKYDGSTESELTTPISTFNNFAKITKIVNYLREKDIKITNKDSVHVHMQAGDVPKHNIIAAWIQIESVIIKCFPEHRRNNTYCERLITKKKYQRISDFFMKAEAEAMEHHAIVSLQYYQERKTVEFRIMEGSTDSNAIKQWVKFCMIFLNYAKSIDPIEIICNKGKPVKNLDNLIDLLKINDEKIVEFLRDRFERFRR